ncbi:MAG: YeeE/YedE thiosulfate transporter family protein [Phaeodactylibacter sp.]|uniref:DUF6691 family protein n=1 Tax=Phaeodactylibacter sp. TaxID=1940289 RepID=UPI0032EE3C88
MKNLSFLAVGIFFGIVMAKSEAVSWFRIHEMFRFESFHMYGIIGTAVVLGAASMWLMKKTGMTTLRGTLVGYNPMNLNIKRHLLAGTIFGLGWALVGCCPGPMYVLLGSGYAIMLVILAGATLGTFTYGLVMKYLPH